MSSAVEQFQIQSTTSNSNDGSFNLSWKLPEDSRIELQQYQQNENDYQTFYTGKDSATVITGLPDGDYNYRARLINTDGGLGDWTESISVTVKHHSLTRAFSFFLVGAVVFAGTLLLILFGSKTGKRR
jgi:hypothetical protein